MPGMTATLPPCPITGEPALECLQMVSPKLLTDLWRFGMRVAPTPLRRDGPRIGLYRAASGLLFFHPAIAGDAGFYRRFYGRTRGHERLSAGAPEREDFRAAAALVRPGDRVLDVGCGHGAFAARIPGARYQGLEPTAPPPREGPPILAETAAAHAARCAGAYDVACAFQVLEHVEDPRGLAEQMLRCLRPGGLLVLSMPLTPSVLTEVPNNLVNLPPHHLTWWNEAACAALCRVLGLEPVRIGPVPSCRMNAVLHWVARLSAVRAGPGRHVRRGWGVQAALLAAYLGARALAPLLGLPRGAGPVDLVLVARKP